jgi:DNA-binding CsgD family transcriptional regulator
MPTLARRDMEALLRLVHDASTLDRERPFTPDLLARLQELVPTAEFVTYCELDWDSRRIPYMANQFEVTDWEEAAEAYWELRDQHAVCEYFVRTGDLRPRKITDLLRPREWRARELYNVCYRPNQYEVDFRLTGPSGYTKTFLFHSSRRDFTERDRLMLELLQPYLQRIEASASTRRRVVNDSPLTRREHEILAWVDRGKTNAEIAEVLWISPGTVRKHLENVYEKLGVQTRTAAVARLRRG